MTRGTTILPLSAICSTIALASDGTTRFYYGPLKDGIPDGQGVRIALVDSWTDTASYFWIEGTWQQGTLTGSGRIYMGDAPEEPYGEYVGHVEIQCDFDGTSEEIMEEAVVFQQRIQDYYHDVSEPEVYQYSYCNHAQPMSKPSWGKVKPGKPEIPRKNPK